MTDLPAPTLSHLALLEDHHLLALAVYEVAPDDTLSAVYEHALAEDEPEPVEPLLEANTWLTAVLPRREAPLVLGSAEGDVVFAGDDVDAAEVSERAVSALLQVGEATVAVTTAGEVMAIEGEEIVPWKEEGPALFAAALVDGTLWIAGDAGYLARREGESWVEVATGTEQTLLALTASRAGVLAVGGAGAVVQVEGGQVTTRTVGPERLVGVAHWRGRVLLSTGIGGLRELTTEGTKVLREGRCEAVAADDKYLVIASGHELLVTEDEITWRSLAFAAPTPDELEHDHDHDGPCDHQH